jgi:hypothetical protein
MRLDDGFLGALSRVEAFAGAVDAEPAPKSQSSLRRYAAGMARAMTRRSSMVVRECGGGSSELSM